MLQAASFVLDVFGNIVDDANTALGLLCSERLSWESGPVLNLVKIKQNCPLTEHGAKTQARSFLIVCLFCVDSNQGRDF